MELCRPCKTAKSAARASIKTHGAELRHRKSASGRLKHDHSQYSKMPNNMIMKRLARLKTCSPQDPAWSQSPCFASRSSELYAVASQLKLPNTNG